ncbi:MAG TPA: beta-ketoacyl synthase chain length factor [Niabella sp.]|nr:beta-ketoacyl synthase chain length factor [Niabella sp.]HOZ97923.1 beta-ketoacyl synthase chain length factor [Niabella sp.]HQW15931.1 beta-ketoacyl synthase chain length factor [Niabella sp.]HQX21121.1 beta-ketoacyl synthase chain length factor [Niabella sp.]HQX40569.1 beta-ketoacyl synthase chain length factor [Niabella sp.]
MYIHQHSCISPQQRGNQPNLETISASIDGKMMAIEPTLEGVPPGMLRRMSKAVRMGIGTGLPLLKDKEVAGIIVGSANGGMQECIKFLNQIVDYDEGLLTPGNFVQSTPNAIAGQLSIITKNHGYNATHVHNGLSFENALLDARMMIAENSGKTFLVGGVDEISTYNYTVDTLAGWYDSSKSNISIYENPSPATVAGEGSAMFLVNDRRENAIAKIEAIELFHSSDEAYATTRIRQFLERYLKNAEDYLLLTGENGDQRFISFYQNGEALCPSTVTVARFKHTTGEFPTATAIALWLSCLAIQEGNLPTHFYKQSSRLRPINKVLIYNQYQGQQHSLLLISKD